MAETPDDLMSLLEVLATYRPQRRWWKSRIDAGDILPYHIPGERGLWLSRVEVERLLRPQPLKLRTKPKEEPTE